MGGYRGDHLPNWRNGPAKCMAVKPPSTPPPHHHPTSPILHFTVYHACAHRGATRSFDTANSSAHKPPPPTWQCHPQDGSVSRDGAIVDASRPCNWALAESSRRAPGRSNASCAGAELLASIERREVDRRNLQVALLLPVPLPLPLPLPVAPLQSQPLVGPPGGTRAARRGHQLVRSLRIRADGVR